MAMARSMAMTTSKEDHSLPQLVVLSIVGPIVLASPLCVPTPPHNSDTTFPQAMAMLELAQLEPIAEIALRSSSKDQPSEGLSMDSRNCGVANSLSDSAQQRELNLPIVDTHMVHMVSMESIAMANIIHMDMQVMLQMCRAIVGVDRSFMALEWVCYGTTVGRMAVDSMACIGCTVADIEDIQIADMET